MATKTKKPTPNEVYIAVISFAGHDVNVAQGLRLRGDNPIVEKFFDRFLPESTPDDEITARRAVLNAPPPPPEPLGRVRLRVLPGQGIDTLAGGGPPQTGEQGGRTYLPGDTLQAEGADAQYLIDGGFCEIVESLPKRLAKAGEAIATGRESA
jgi:hypothetical protein